MSKRVELPELASVGPAFFGRDGLEVLTNEQKAEVIHRCNVHDELVEALGMMTSLCSLKYGNTNKDVAEWIERANALMADEKCSEVML